VRRVDLARYARQILLPEVGGGGQLKLSKARVLIVGAGGLGSPAALYLAGAGVGQLTLIDNDPVDLTNLHRQILHGTPDLGTPKVLSARRRLTHLNPGVRVKPLNKRLTSRNVDAVFKIQDLILDGSDNFDTRYLVNDAAVRHRVPLVWGAVLRWEGQAMTVVPGRSACYRCLFPEPPDPAVAQSCADGGVLGPIAGVVGALMAAEAVKVLLGVGVPLTGRLLQYDGRAARFRERAANRRGNCSSCGGRDVH
jgi:molybdopterin/thiamine biosynthesis adenylyltransferase